MTYQPRNAMLSAARALLAPGTVYDENTRATVDGLFHGLDALENIPAQDLALADRRAARVAFAKVLRGARATLTREEKRRVDGNHHSVLNIAEGSPATGGDLVPTLLFPELLTRLKFYSSVASIARFIPTESGAPVTLATMDDSTNAGSLLAEASTAPDSDVTFGTKSLGGYNFTSGVILVSFQIMQDSGIDIVSILLDLLAIRIGRAQNSFFTTGTGTGQPQGVVTGASLGVTLPTGNTTSVTYNGLVQLYQSVDAAYRSSPSAAWMMHDNTLLAIKQLTDASNLPLWLPDILAAPDGSPRHGSLLGKPVIVNNDMATMAANAKPIVFGDFSQYAIRQVRSVAMLQMQDSAYARKSQAAFVAFSRADGRVLWQEALKYLQNSAT